MWMHSKDGNYSVKTGYNAIQNWINNDHPGSSNQDFMNSVQKNLWGLKTIPNIKTLHANYS